MYSIQTKDNNNQCDLANLTNVYNSDNIHHYMVDKYTRNKHTKVHFLSNALSYYFLELGKFVRRDFLHSVIQQITGSFVL